MSSPTQKVHEIASTLERIEEEQAELMKCASGLDEWCVFYYLGLYAARWGVELNGQPGLEIRAQVVDQNRSLTYDTAVDAPLPVILTIT